MTVAPESVDAVVVGAGVVGLAIARSLAASGIEVVILEAEPSFGTGASSRNSEVVHAGLYDPPHWWKARLCVDGRERLYAYCRARGIAHAQLGKLVVATRPEHEATLDAIEANATGNGVAVERWNGARVAALEPAVRCRSALWSPASGIVDSHGFVRSLLGDAIRDGAAIAYRCPFRTAIVDGDRLLVHTDDVDLRCSILINAAGLGAQAVASNIADLDPGHVPPLHLAKGNYFVLPGPSPFRHLVYPVPDTASLGIHLTLDLDGRARFGPDQVFVDRIDYTVDETRREAFERAVAAYFPALPRGVLQPGYAGIRAKVQAPGQPKADFVIQGPDAHGIAGLVNLFGIESPGLTASLALADAVVRLVQKNR